VNDYVCKCNARDILEHIKGYVVVILQSFYLPEKTHVQATPGSKGSCLHEVVEGVLFLARVDFPFLIVRVMETSGRISSRTAESFRMARIASKNQRKRRQFHPLGHESIFAIHPTLTWILGVV
jgi:hypothetical protein